MTLPHPGRYTLEAPLNSHTPILHRFQFDRTPVQSAHPTLRHPPEKRSLWSMTSKKQFHNLNAPR
eukprot:m.105298 g.105298  ORF g.105298 m.105298 type:complete len:65 (-) comp12640_c1_seq2:186-380(-)